MFLPFSHVSPQFSTVFSSKQDPTVHLHAPKARQRSTIDLFVELHVVEHGISFFLFSRWFFDIVVLLCIKNVVTVDVEETLAK